MVVIKGPSFLPSPTDSPDLLQVTRLKQRASATAPSLPLPQLADSAKAASTCPTQGAKASDATSTLPLSILRNASFSLSHSLIVQLLENWYL